jgi:hypothetical protein
MIIEDRIKEFNYASILVADYHQEYPLGGIAQVIWDPNAIEEVMRALRVTDVDLTMTCAMLFRDLPSRYNGGYDHNDTMLLYRIKGSPDKIEEVFQDLAQQLMGGPRGADDDTFDYWPNAFDMLYVMAQDLIALTDHPRWILDTVVRVIDSAIALQGPLSEWEAEELDTMLQHLMELNTKRIEELDIIHLNDRGEEAL